MKTVVKTFISLIAMIFILQLAGCTSPNKKPLPKTNEYNRNTPVKPSPGTPPTKPTKPVPGNPGTPNTPANPKVPSIPANPNVPGGPGR